jgi:hypothetical protein
MGIRKGRGATALLTATVGLAAVTVAATGTPSQAVPSQAVPNCRNGYVALTYAVGPIVRGLAGRGLCPGAISPTTGKAVAPSLLR